MLSFELFTSSDETVTISTSVIMKAISIIILFTFLVEYSKCGLTLSAVDIGSLSVGTARYEDCGMRFTGTISIKVKI